VTQPRSQQLLNRLLAEKKRRAATTGAPHVRLVDSAFPQQKAFIEDPAPLKAAICSRRAGKSYGIGLLLFQEALDHPGCSCLYLAETYGQTKKSMFRQVMLPINRQFNLGARFNEGDLSIRLPNGSVIYLTGMDSSMQQQESIRGSHFRLIVVDEAGSFRNDLRALVEETLMPAVLDDMGTICLIGTPRAIKNMFFEVVTGKEPGWAVHRWMVTDNPHTRKEYELAQVRAKMLDADYASRPRWRQEWLAEWIMDEGTLVYRYDKERNTAGELPPDEKWLHVVGVDLGFNDDSAWVVCAYNLHDSRLYVREVKAEKGLILSQVAAFTHHLVDTYSPHALVIDGAAKQAVEELRQRYDLPFEAADKLGKYDAIQMLNSDLVTGRVKLLPGTEALAKEWGDLVWDERAMKNMRHVEDPRCPNHLSDAMLYAWRRCRNYTPQLKETTPPPGSAEAMDAWWEAEGERMERRDRLEWFDEDVA